VQFVLRGGDRLGTGRVFIPAAVREILSFIGASDRRGPGALSRWCACPHSDVARTDRESPPSARCWAGFSLPSRPFPPCRPAPSSCRRAGSPHLLIEFAGLNAHDVRQAVAHLVHHVMGHVAVDCPIGGIVGDERDRPYAAYRDKDRRFRPLSGFGRQFVSPSPRPGNGPSATASADEAQATRRCGRRAPCIRIIGVSRCNSLGRSPCSHSGATYQSCEKYWSEARCLCSANGFVKIKGKANPFGIKLN
jgi:hypothetical protein